MLWKILPKKSENLIEQLLINRGITSEKQKEQFFNPKLSDFEKSLNIKGIANAKKRIEKAIEQGEQIIVYGDYDVDGICGAAVLYLGLSSIGAKVLPYIPHREKEGYGLSEVGLEFARDSGAGLVITVDCGIVNFEQALFAKKLGMDLIITDHHQTLEGKLPEALEIVHSIEICGSAVGWCLVRSLISEEKAEELLDFVAMATVADMMPLLGVNRAFVKLGLEKLNNTKRVGLLALFAEAGITRGNISSYEIGHIISPRLNAMGRLEHAIDSLRLLCTKDPTKAGKLAELIGSANAQRKELTVKAFDEAKLMVNGSAKKIHIVASSDWIPGIIGLVAGRVSEDTKVPAIAISVGEVHSKGSARSASGINIVETIRKCSDILVAVGGHKGAAGFTIETTKIEEFKVRLEQLIDSELILQDDSLKIEAEVESSELNLKLARELERLEPFGVANQRPVLASKNMRLSDVRTVGQALPASRQGKHLKGKADDVDFIAFGMGEMEKVLKAGQFIDLVYTPEVDSFNGFEKLQLKVKDIVLSGNS